MSQVQSVNFKVGVILFFGTISYSMRNAATLKWNQIPTKLGLRNLFIKKTFFIIVRFQTFFNSKLSIITIREEIMSAIKEALTIAEN